MVKVMISDADLLKYNRAGLIPGPNEEASVFIERVQHCLGIKVRLEEEGGPPCKGSRVDLDVCGETPLILTEELYDTRPTWVPLYFSNYRLAPWHGGCAWLFQFTPLGPLSAFLQLRKKCWLGYGQNEIVAHELAHVGRMAFDEPRFEEMLAFQTSPHAWRRILSPVMQAGWESFAFVFMLLFTVAVDVYFLGFAESDPPSLLMWMKLLPAFAIFGAGFRLWRCHRTFKRALASLTETIGDRRAAQRILYRLADHEIQQFSKSTPQAIRSYAASQKEASLRWRLLNLAYF